MPCAAAAFWWVKPERERDSEVMQLYKVTKSSGTAGLRPVRLEATYVERVPAGGSSRNLQQLVIASGRTGRNPAVPRDFVTL